MEKEQKEDIKYKLPRFFKDYKRGDFPHQRLGQAFCNYFKLRDPLDATERPIQAIFYEENLEKTIDKIVAFLGIGPDDPLKRD